MLKRIVLVANGLERRYWWWEPPASLDSPLLLFLAGTGASPTWADTETGWSAAAQRHRFTLVLPEALPVDPCRPPHFQQNPTRWRNHDDPSAPSLSPRPVIGTGEPSSNFATPSIDDVAFLDAVLNDVEQRRGGRANAVFVTGFSSGAAMTFRYAASRSERLTAIAPVAGYCRCPAHLRPARALPTLYIIGDSDPLVPLHGGMAASPWEARLVRRPPVVESLERWAELMGCSSVPLLLEDNAIYRRQVYPGPVPFHVLIVKGQGHHWPGGRGGWSHPLAGPHHRQLVATEVIWEFFQKQIGAH